MSSNRKMLIAALGGSPQIRKTYKHIPANQVNRILQTHPMSGRFANNMAALIHKLELKNKNMKPQNNLANMLAGMALKSKPPKKTSPLAMSGLLAAIPVIRKVPTRGRKVVYVKKRAQPKRSAANQARYEALILNQLRKPHKTNLAKPMNVEKM